MAFQKVIVGSLGLLTAGGVSGTAYRVMSSSQTESSIASSENAQPRNQESGGPVSAVRSSPSGSGRTAQSSTAIRSMSSVNPNPSTPKADPITYRFSNGSKSAELTCANEKYPGASHDKQKDVIVCQSGTKQYSFQWFAAQGQSPSCELEGSSNFYRCTSKRKNLQKVTLQGHKDITTREAIHIS
ncbi:hypothetical protein MHLP_03080 [Candidatus Mycoplasma haematolamae str. Purdue]|uniref:Uncharacterized protein n=1 Tax=Mycoplasma haematolamae (strain Purdue) TaxID=1212765 RepID=I7CG36_MYCHA|nr:hypothetical protein [Candidatus Mycoplasma haematolamae]AFO52196.1 hypothetical protein MHLP_03080 [Candidatus Mycoplasma haematolamae str. Purdue]